MKGVTMKKKYKSNEFDKVEEKLIREEQRSKKQGMPVSGKSVFNIKQIKDDKRQKRG